MRLDWSIDKQNAEDSDRQKDAPCYRNPVGRNTYEHRYLFRNGSRPANGDGDGGEEYHRNDFVCSRRPAKEIEHKQSKGKRRRQYDDNRESCLAYLALESFGEGSPGAMMPISELA